MASTPEKTIDRLLQQRRIPGQITLGLGGGSGSGKSTIAAAIEEGLRPSAVEVIVLDRFFKADDDLPKYYSDYHGERRPDYNRPDSLQVDDMLSSCSAPRRADVVIFDGHLVFCYPRMRQLIDLKMFVDASIEEMLTRRTERNVAAGYGGDRDAVRNYNRECVVPGYKRHVLPSRAHADIVISNAFSSPAARDAIVDTLCLRILAALHTSEPHELPE